MGRTACKPDRDRLTGSSSDYTFSVIALLATLAADLPGGCWAGFLIAAPDAGVIFYGSLHFATYCFPRSGVGRTMRCTFGGKRRLVAKRP
jgi:hypothetical protein